MPSAFTLRIGGADLALPDDWAAARDVTRGEYESLRECVDQLVAVLEAQRLTIDAIVTCATAQTAAISHLAGLLVAAGVAHAGHG
jgi:hypothetical protein